MNAKEWLVMYLGGCVLAILFNVLKFGDWVESTSGNRLVRLLTAIASIILWPLILPLSFLVLWLTLCWIGLLAGLYIAKLCKLDISIRGRTPAQTLTFLFPEKP